MTTQLTGRVVSGAGQGAQFTRLDWAREQFIEKLGLDPFPGTLNLTLDTPEALATWTEWKMSPGVLITPPTAKWCNARCYPVRVANGTNGAVVIPEVQNYPQTQIEIIAAVPLRTMLALKDGDALTLEFDEPSGKETSTHQEPRKRALAYLGAHNVMTVATNGPGGLWAAAVFYVNDELNLYFLSAPSSRHSLNLAANPRVAATIQQEYDDWRAIKGVQLEGHATRIEGLAQARALALYGKKFPLVAKLAQAPVEIARAFDRIAWYRITPTRLYFIDNGLGFGHRDEIVEWQADNG